MIAARNLAKAWLLLVGFCLVLAALGWALERLPRRVDLPLLRAPAQRRRPRLLRRPCRARDGRRERAAARRGADACTRRSSGSRCSPGVPKPRLYLLPDPHPRALSAGRGTRGAAVARLARAVALLSPAELEGVLAHELAKIHNRDVTVQTPLVVLSAMMIELSRIGGWLERALLMFLGPISAAFLHLMLSTKREFAADRIAAGFCGSPHGLADALIRLEQTEELFPFESSPGDRAALHDQPVPGDGPRGAVRHAPAGRRSACGACARSTRTGERNSAPAMDRRQLSAKQLPETRRARAGGGLVAKLNRRRPTLPGGCPPSTIGPGRLNFSVRNGKRCFPAGMTAEIVERRTHCAR